MAVFALQLNDPWEGKVTNTPQLETESKKVRNKFLKVKLGYCDNKVSLKSRGRTSLGSLTNTELKGFNLKHKSWYKRFGGSWLNILA